MIPVKHVGAPNSVIRAIEELPLQAPTTPSIRFRSHDYPSRSLAALFDVLSHETRIEIVAALYEADAPVAYAQLKAEIGIRDNGKFNYHLRTLSEDLLRRTDGGYALTDTGTTFFERTVASEPR